MCPEEVLSQVKQKKWKPDAVRREDSEILCPLSMKEFSWDAAVYILSKYVSKVNIEEQIGQGHGFS